MFDVMVLNGDTTVSCRAKEATDDVRLIIDGPRPPCTVVNEANGMILRITVPVAAGDRLWIECRTQVAYLKAKRAGAEKRDCGADVHPQPHPQGSGWMMVARGMNTIQIVPL